MSKKADRPLLIDMIQSIEKVLDYTAGMDEAAFIADRLTCDAVIYNIQIIGEAASKLSDRIKEDHPEVPWHQVIGMRHRLVHEYGQVRIDIIWRVASIHIPPLMEQLKKILEQGIE